MLQKQMALWNHASIRVLDVRRSMVRPGETVDSFRLPASMYLYVDGGRGEIRIDGVAHTVDQSYVCHAGKGASMDILRVAEPMDYYLIFYKAVLMLPCRQELLDLYRDRDRSPFLAPYGYVPAYPLSIHTRMEQIHRLWQVDDRLEKFHVRALFHQLVYEMMKQLHQAGGTGIFQADLASQAARYIEDHYAESFGLQDLAELLRCGVRQLQRQFKEKHRMGPLEYLIRVRMDRAKDMLLSTDATIKQIAEAVGYADLYYFSRSFKKYFGVSPLHYRRDRRKNASLESQPSIGSKRAFSYSYVDDENHYQQTNEGAARMHTSARTLVAVNLMLIFILLLGACSSGNSGKISGSKEPAPTQSSSASPVQSPAQAAQPSYPVTIKHMKGEYTLEQRPERIAVLDVQFVDQLVALGEQPAGSVTAAGADADFPEYLSDKISDVKVLGTYQEPNLEALVAMNPDFIVCTEVHEAIYDNLSKIAPTIMLLRNEDWRDTLATFGKMMGKEKEAEQVLQAYKEKTDKLAAELAAKLNGQSVALIRPRDDMIRVHTPEHRTGAILYKDLGLVPPKQVAEEKDTAYQISLEALADVGGDHYFLLSDDMFKGLVEEFQNTTTWKSLEPVKNNRVYTVDTTMWIGYYGPMAINLVVDQVADALLGKS